MSTRRFAVVTALALAGLGSLGACGSWYQRPPETASAPCTGQRYLDVRNSLESALEIYGYPPTGGNARYLGTVSPGTQRIPLTDPVGTVYAEAGGRRITQARTKNSGTSALSITRGCEAATN